MKKRYLVLQDGTVFCGEAFGAEGEAVGELVFTTGMGGYAETVTDPDYYGQLVLQTFPLIGNCGMISQKCEGKAALSGYIVREYCEHPSDFRCELTLDEFLKQRGVPAVAGLDTRELTRIIRENGVTNAMLCDEPPKALSALREYRVRDAVRNVSADDTGVYPSEGERSFRVALLDYGAKRHILRELVRRGCEVTVFPASSPADRIRNGGFDGLVLSDGPGDPAENQFSVAQIQLLFGELPMFGIGLGHQLMALSQGGKTVKLKYGHRGANQPVRDLVSGRTYITAQNHGYAVLSESVPNAKPCHVHANDGTCEGLEYENAFSVQFHPETFAGPHDTVFLFDRFCKMMEENQNAD